MLQVFVDALVRASELALVAIGLTTVLGQLKFANIAQVEFATIGGFLTLYLATSAGMGLLLGTLVGVILTAVLGVALYHLVFKRLLKSGPTIAMIGSLAVSIMIRAVIQMLAGTAPRSYDLPLERSYQLGGVEITPIQLRVVVITLAALGAFMALQKYTRLGRAMRATAANRELAEASGINTARVTDAVWLVSAGLAALGGVLLGMDTQLSLSMGFDLLLPVFAVIIVGGIGSPGGAMLAALLIAGVENAFLKIDFGALWGSAAYIPISYRSAVGFLLIIVTLVYRPDGLLGRGSRRA
jgi:branched-chain amino acid transport system permease protein